MSKLDQAIAEKNIVGLQNLLKAYLTGDPTDSKATIKQSLQKIQASGIEIWQHHDGKILNTSSKESWDEDYFVDLQVDLRMNFSEERFLHMLEVGKKVYGIPVKQTVAGSTHASRPTTKIAYTQSADSGKKNSALLWGAVAVGAVILMAVVFKMINSNK
ncbi:hypothetical protein [Heyndrickxia ginsengihumi]|uniref:hypothetical protein n=1 Tax=Heyndrickxia ginsengihumi TaxID=363870 RepID=UPI00203C75E9|nr:hypothetical protein [Heyndrickxia ginsengihumi]MCM3024410.1 hypothetical protein [Heyndrickxia ginsengihumi]